MSRSIWHAQGTQSLNTDVCIIGAGLLGASTAYWGRRLTPGLDIVLLDRHWPAYGASGRNAARVVIKDLQRHRV